MERAENATMKPRKRHGGVELFRLLMMVLVVLCHICSLQKPDGAVLIPLAISLLGVPGFVSISGAFGIKFSWRKWFSLWGCMAFYGVLSYFCPHETSNGKLLVSGGWFLAPYLVLMAFAPVINAGIASCCAEKGGRRKLLLLMAFILVVTWIASWPYGWSQRFTGMYLKEFGRKSLFVILATYVIARTVATSERVRRLSLKSLFGILVITGSCFFAQLAAFRYAIDGETVSNVWKILPYCGYNSIFVVAFAVTLLLLFQRLDLPERWGSVLTFVNASLLPVYLIHSCTSAGRYYLCKQLYDAVFRFVGKNQGLAIALSVAACFVACVVLDMLARRAPLCLLRKAIARIPRKGGETQKPQNML